MNRLFKFGYLYLNDIISKRIFHKTNCAIIKSIKPRASVEENYNYKLKSFSETETINIKLDIETVKSLILKNLEPFWVAKLRFDSFKIFNKMLIPSWCDCTFEPTSGENSIHYSAVLKHQSVSTENPINQTDDGRKTAVDLVIDSVSVSTSYQKELNKAGIIFNNLSVSISKYPDLVSCYIGSVVSIRDNYYACLNSSVFSEGSFIYVPKNTICPLDLSTYFRINGSVIGQFERTLIITEDSSKVSYLEGCTAPYFTSNQLHAAVVELIAIGNSEIKYSTVQNWYPGNSEGNGGIYNFVTKRGLCLGENSKISWTQVETGSSLTWKYPSVILNGNNTVGEFYSIAITKLRQQADTGSKMIHIGNKSYSKIISKGISLGESKNCYRGLVYIHNNSFKSKNTTQCDSIIFGNRSSANTFPYIIVKDSSSWLEHEASIAKVQDDQIFYLQQRGLNFEESLNLILGGFCKEVIEELPLEFLSEVNELLNSSLVTKIG